MKQKKKQTPKYREQQWLPVDRGLGIVGGQCGRYKPLGVIQAHKCVVHHEEYSQYFVTTVNG